MEKLKFGENEFEFIPNGIANENVNKTRKYSFKTDIAYADLLNILSDTDNLENVQYLSESGEILITYVDCASLKSLTYVPNYKIDDSTTANIYVAEISVDAIEKAINKLTKEANITADALEAIITMVLGV